MYVTYRACEPAVPSVSTSRTLRTLLLVSAVFVHEVKEDGIAVCSCLWVVLIA